jgi:DNA-dependent RNA polymerase auxiliary subunit epsilon
MAIGRPSWSRRDSCWRERTVNVLPSPTRRTETMPNLLMYSVYLDARAGVSVEELADVYGFSLEYIEERLAAAKLCFDKQVHHFEFSKNG